VAKAGVTANGHGVRDSLELVPKADSREMLVRWPATLGEGLTIFPKASHWDSLGTIAGRLPPVRIAALFV
jgi:hypothetical protein